MNKDQSMQNVVTFTVQFGPADLGSIQKILIINRDSERSGTIRLSKKRDFASGIYQSL